MRVLPAVLAAAMVTSPAAARQATVASLRVAATTPTIASLVRAVGGDDVAVTVLQYERGTPGEARQAAALAQSQLIVRNGDRAESQWLGPRLQAIANAALRPGGRAHVDASQLGSPADCSPSELLDPLRGLALAGAVRDALERLRPARRQAFTERYEAFRARLAVAMLGERLGAKYPLEKVADLHRLGRLETFLGAQRESTLLGGWFGQLRGRQGVKAGSDRAAWGCFARRFGIDVVTVASQPDSAAHWKKREIALLLVGMGDGTEPLSDAARRAGVPVAALASQVGAVAGAKDYVALIDFDVRAVGQALGGVPRGPSTPGP